MIEIPGVPWLEITGGHEPRGYHVMFSGDLQVLPHNPFEWLLELTSVALRDREAYLYNRQSFSCGKLNRHGVRNFDETARDRARHLRKLLRDYLQTGRKSYRLSPTAGELNVSPRVLDIHGLVKRIVERLREAISSHALVTQFQLDPASFPLGLRQRLAGSSNHRQ